MNKFGELFSFTTWGESHGEAIGCVVDGCPSLLELNESDIQNISISAGPGNQNSPHKDKKKTK
jgi:chorismate synthase